ncbi:condensation domain-containing protein [Modestobacter sp. VKM Ac-2984]|uniref:condensation domain-containing protein n=1 Tax=Modestobacter sp. VKM Ac-2984 TaxID=3004138 RepID=UPI0022AB1C55|nr:condensation domain-containing protein [Modestobacter sp. VKM Ac-2984]MCZ2817160.1 condensation domain-containing protein [Modestobacter sp. VKM Ac-2984]
MLTAAGPATGPGSGPAAGGPPLSWPQEVLWLAERMRPGTVLDPRCAVHRAFHFPEPPDLALLGRALTAVVARHDGVRTVPVPEDDGVRLVVCRPSAVTVEIAPLPLGAGDDEVRRGVLAAATAPYDLAAGPLLRAAWLPRDRGGTLVLALHHWAGDVAALDALQQEAAELYACLRDGRPAPPEPPGYAALAAARRAADPAGHEELSAWWRTELAGARRGALPGSGAGRTGGATGLLARPLGGPASTALLELTAVHRASPYMVLLAAIGALLDDGRDDPDHLDATVFTVDGGRSGSDRRVIGFLSEPLPLRLRLDRTQPFGAAVAAARTTVLAAMGHRDVPFVRLLQTAPRLAVALLRGRRPATLVQYFAPADLDLGGRRGHVLPTFPATGAVEAHPWAVPVDLDVTVERQGAEHSVAVLFDPGLWDRADLESALDRLEAVLTGGLADPVRPLARLAAGGPR